MTLEAFFNFFNGHPLSDVMDMINDVTTKIVTDFDAAQAVFVWTQKYFIEATRYFTLEDKCSDYVELIR